MTHSKNSEKQQEKADFFPNGSLRERQLMQTYLQEYLEQEMACHLGALPYERTQHRRGHRNGYKPCQLNPADGGIDPASCGTSRRARQNVALMRSTTVLCYYDSSLSSRVS